MNDESSLFLQTLKNVKRRAFLLYRKVLLWRTLDIKVARTEAGIANKR